MALADEIRRLTPEQFRRYLEYRRQGMPIQKAIDMTLIRQRISELPDRVRKEKGK